MDEVIRIFLPYVERAGVACAVIVGYLYYALRVEHRLLREKHDKFMEQQMVEVKEGTVASITVIERNTAALNTSAAVQKEQTELLRNYIVRGGG